MELNAYQEQKVIKDSYPESEIYYRTLLNSMLEDIIVIDRNYRIADVNNTFLVTSGHSRNQVIGRHCYEVSHGYDEPCYLHGEECKLTQVFETGAAYKCRHEHLKSDGSIVLVDIFLSPLKDKKGKITHVIETVRDVTDIMRTKQALTDSKERLRAFSNALPDIAFILDEDGRYVEVLSAGEHLPYKSTADLQGRLLHDVLSQEDADRFMAISQRAIATNESQVLEYELDMPVGKRCFEARISPMQVSLNGKKMVAWISRDISYRKESESAIQNSEGLLRATFKTSADGILVVNEKGQAAHTNSRFAEMWGIPEKILTTGDDEKLLDYILDNFEEPQSVLSRIQALYKSSQEDFETLFLKDGRVFERYSCPLIRDGKIAGRVWSFRNITEGIRAKKEVEDKTHLNQTLFDALPCVALLLRPNREIVISNKAGRNAGAVPGMQCFATWGQREDPCPWCLAPKALTTGEAHHIEIEARGVVWDVHWIPVSSDLYLHYTFDITEKRKLNQRLQQAQKMESIGTLAGGIAHDFNNILFPIIGYTEMTLEDVPHGSNAKKNLAEILTATHRAKDLVSQILTFSRQSDNKRSPIMIQPIIKEALKLLRSTLPTTIKIHRIRMN